MLFATLLTFGGPLLWSVLSAGLEPWQVHVAPNGNDSNKGSLSDPLQTWQGALQLLRQQRPKGQPVDVLFHPGVYFVDNVQMTDKDSGEEDAPVTFMPYQNGTVEIVGGIRLGKWKRIAQNSSIWVTRLGPSLTGVEVLDFAELFVNKRAMMVARWPNEGWAEVYDVPGGHSFDRFWYAGTDNGWRWSKRNGQYARICGYLYWDFMFQCTKVTQVVLAEQSTNASPPEGAKGMIIAAERSYGYRPGGRFFIDNSRLELDAPGEYYIEMETGTVYLWPPSGVNMENADIYLSSSNTALTMQGVQHVILQSLEFHYFRDTVIRIEDSYNVSLDHCTIANGGMDGLIIKNSSYSGIISSEIHSLGYGGLILIGGDRRKLQPSQLYAVGNVIHSVSRVLRTYHPAIHIHGCGVQVRRNRIFNIPHAALEVNGNNHVVDSNEFTNISFECGDCGAVMATRSFSYLGNVISHNVFRNVWSPFTKEENVRAIFLDDHASGFVIVGNTFYNCSDAVLLGGGRQNRVIYNRFFDCDTCVYLSQRGMQEECMGNGSMSHDLNSFNWRHPPWAAHYPHLAEAQDASDFRKCSPILNYIVANKCDVSCRRFCNIDLYQLHTWFTEFEDNIIECEHHGWLVTILLIMLGLAGLGLLCLVYFGQHGALAHRLLGIFQRLRHQLSPHPPLISKEF